MIILDEAAQERLKTQLAREEERERQRQWAMAELQDCRVVLDPNTSPANVERQMGKRMSLEEFERKVQQLDPAFHFEVVPGNTTKKYLWHSRPDGRAKICLYENSPMLSEYSLFSTKEEELVDPNIRHISRADLPKATWAGLEYDPDTGDVRGEGYRFESDIRPGLVKISRPWNEIVRGWRTVLAQIVQAGLASPERVERLFGASPRRTWAAKMGKTEQKMFFEV